MQPYLKIINGPQAGQVFPINSDRFTVGRSKNNNLHLEDADVSRQHAVIRVNGGQYFLQDQNSGNGTFVNQTPVNARRLSPGDVIRLGNTDLVFEMSAGAAIPTPIPIKIPIPIGGANNTILPSFMSVTGAVLVLIFFFMPWISVSCSGISVNASGYQMASGTVDAGSAGSYEEEASDSDPLLFIILLVGLATLGLFGAHLMMLASPTAKPSQVNTLAAIGYIGLGSLGLFIQFLKFVAIESDKAQLVSSGGAGLTISYEIGWWVTGFGLIAIALGGVLGIALLYSAGVVPQYPLRR